MSPDTPLFGRLTVGGNRVSLGRAGTTVLLIRVAQQLRKIRPADDTIIQIELSRNNLPDSSTFNRQAREEQLFAERVIVNPDEMSPFPGITIGRVAEVIASPEYEAFNEICDPEKRMTLSPAEIEQIRNDYLAIARECFQHFPKWID